jgi:flavodoxin
MKTLILYYTRTGNTRRISEILAPRLSAECEPLLDEQDYSGPLGYLAGGRDALRNKVATLKPLRVALSTYDCILIGQPVWAAQPVPAVRALLHNPAPFAGKSIALFVTYDGMGDQSCLNRTAELLPEARIVARKSFLRVGKQIRENENLAHAWSEELTAVFAP